MVYTFYVNIPLTIIIFNTFNPLTAGGAEQLSGHFVEGARHSEKYLTYNIIITYF